MFIKLITIDDVKTFVGFANAYPHDISIVSGHYRVDAKSIMGVFSISPNKPIELVIDGDLESEEAKEFLDAIAGYIVAEE